MTMALAAVADYSPGPPVTHAQLEEALGTSLGALAAYFGIEARHWALDPCTRQLREPGLGTSLMSARAGQEALRLAGLEPEGIDALVCGTSTPDTRLPPLPHAVQRALGMRSVASYDLRGGCAVALQALTLASSLIESGRANQVLVTLADTLSPHYVLPLLGVPDPRTEALVNALTFADGAAAAILEPAREEEDRFCLRHVSSRSSFAHRTGGFTVDGGGQTRHDHRAIRDLLPEVMREASSDLEAARIAQGQVRIDHLIVPQVNRSMLELVSTDLHDRLFYLGHRLGNCPAPAVLRALARGIQEGVLVPGTSCIGLIGVETTSWTLGTALIR